MNLGMTASEYQALQECAKGLPGAVQSPAAPTPVAPAPVALSLLEKLALEDATVLSREKLIHKYGSTIADRAIELAKSRAPTVQQAFGKRQRAIRHVNAEFGKELAAAGVQVQQHSVKEYTLVIMKQLDLLLGDAIPSVRAVANAVFPDNPKKATSIQNSRHGKRWKQAWNSPEVTNHPLEIAMQLTHGPSDMNGRCTAGTFGQSLRISRNLFKSCDRITKLEARVQLLEQQMACTKNREVLADAGCATSREKVLALTHEGKGPAAIAKLLDMPYETVRTIRRRSKQ